MNQVLRNTFHGGSTQTFDSLHNFYDVCFRSHERNSTHEMNNTYCFFYGITICVFRFRIQIHSPVLQQITLRLCNELNVLIYIARMQHQFSSKKVKLYLEHFHQQFSSGVEKSWQSSLLWQPHFLPIVGSSLYHMMRSSGLLRLRLLYVMSRFFES